MDYDSVFAAYYTIYRTEAQTPASSDDEYVVGLQLANEAVDYWADYDGTVWDELYTTAQTNSTGGVVTITTGTKTYAAPTAMKEPGGFVTIDDAQGNTVQRYPIIKPGEAQFAGDQNTYCFFTGNSSQGFTLHLNPAPPSSLNGLAIEYVYTKKPTQFTAGTDKTEMSKPYFLVHRMLAMRFRGSRNPYYSTALRDSENAVRTMQLKNNAGTVANPISVPDRSGTAFGV